MTSNALSQCPVPSKVEGLPSRHYLGFSLPRDSVLGMELAEMPNGLGTAIA